MKLRKSSEVYNELEKEVKQAIEYRQKIADETKSWYASDDTILNVIEGIMRYMRYEADEIIFK